MVTWTTSGRAFSSIARWSVNQVRTPYLSAAASAAAGERSQMAVSSTPGKVFRQERCCFAICPAPISAAFTRLSPGSGGRNPPGSGPPRSSHIDRPPAASPTDRCARPAPGSARSRSTASAKAAGSSSMRMSRPGTASIPSAPSVVETMAFPMAMASTILRRVPPPRRSGTTTAAAAARCGRRSGTKPVSSTRGPASARSDGGGRPPMILKRASGRASAMRGQISWTKWITRIDIGDGREEPEIDHGPAVGRRVGGARLVEVDVCGVGNDRRAHAGRLVEQALFIRRAAHIDAVRVAVGPQLLPPQLAPVGAGVEATARRCRRCGRTAARDHGRSHASRRPGLAASCRAEPCAGRSGQDTGTPG